MRVVQDRAEGVGISVIAMLDTSDDLDMASTELGCPVEELLTPLTRRLRRRVDGHFAIDNGAFARFDRQSFLSLLQREQGAKDLCRFVVVPDVVGSARRTLEVFRGYVHHLLNWKLALAAQDGLEDLDIPWKQIACLFIGGTTEWKMSKEAAACIKAAKALGKWVHAGRVNTPARFGYFEELGVDSIDGTGLSRYSWMREKIYRAHTEPNLLEGVTDGTAIS